MPSDACQFFYECKNCGVVLKPNPGDCCIYCSFGTVPCPPIQENNKCCQNSTTKNIIMKQSIGFIGGGRVTRILLQAFKNSNSQFSEIFVNDTNKDVADNLKKEYPEVQIAEALLTVSKDVVFISLHPPVLLETLELLKGSIKSSTIVISLAPKITITKLSSKLNHVKNIVRLIPNATSYINEGYNPVCFSSDFGTNEKQLVLNLLNVMGNTFEIKEEKLESYAIMSAMLPTYFWFQWHELMGIGNKIGLSESECADSIQKTIVGSLDLMFKSGLTPTEVMDLIPVKPIGEHEPQIIEIYKTKLIGLFEKIKP
jgi:pyrroline-5-carboxylate reductase